MFFVVLQEEKAGKCGPLFCKAGPVAKLRGDSLPPPLLIVSGGGGGGGRGLTGDGCVPGSDSKGKKEPAWRASELIQKFGREED